MTTPNDGPAYPTEDSSSAKEYDAALVARFNAGDARAFEEIVFRYRDKIYAVAACIIRNNEDAEEVASDTFIRAHRGLANFRGDSSLSTWLYRIAMNLSRNRYWYWWRRKRGESVSFDAPVSEGGETTLADIIPAPMEHAGDAAEMDERVRIIAACMERLDVRQREILVLRNVLNRSYEEIAAILGINVGTVKSRIARARESLRRLIDQMSRGEVNIKAPSLGAYKARRRSRRA